MRIIYDDYDVRFCEDESYFYIDFLDGGGEYSKEEYTLAEAIADAASSYGMAVWVDKDGHAYGQCNLPMFGYNVELINDNE